MATPIPVQSFTTVYKGRANVLRNQVTVHKGFVPGEEKETPGKTFVALWDTGATNSAVSKRLADALELEPEGIARINTGGGVVNNADVYYVNMMLPNNVPIPMLKVSQLEISGADLLIGMDVIGLGDFAVTCFEGQTTFSFRHPSIEEIDFTGKSPRKKAAMPKVGRNDPCPCGSGKKFKRCHGA